MHEGSFYKVSVKQLSVDNHLTGNASFIILEGVIIHAVSQFGGIDFQGMVTGNLVPFFADDNLSQRIAQLEFHLTCIGQIVHL